MSEVQREADDVQEGQVRSLDRRVWEIIELGILVEDIGDRLDHYTRHYPDTGQRLRAIGSGLQLFGESILEDLILGKVRE